MLQTRLRRWVEALCAPRCAGRLAGSPEGAAAREVIVEALRAAGLDPTLQPVLGGAGANVIARLPGRVPSGRTVLVGAHYDHLGRLGEEAFWGADDNAAGVALVLALADLLGGADAPPVGQVLLVAFDAEEPPHFLTSTMGSFAFTAEPPVPLETIELAVVLDLVGHAIGPEEAPPAVRRSLFVLGAEKSEETATTVARASRATDGVLARPLGIDLIPPLSDYEAFRLAGVPFLFLTCGRWRHYHQVTDTPDRLDYDKLAATARFCAALVREALARRARPVYDDDARDPMTTLATLAAFAAELEAFTTRATSARRTLEAIAARVERTGRPSLADWSTVLQLAVLLEQGLA